MKNPFPPQVGSIPQNEAIDWMDLFHIEEEARQPQLIPGFSEPIDHLDQFFEYFLRQVVEGIQHGIQIIVGGVYE